MFARTLTAITVVALLAGCAAPAFSPGPTVSQPAPSTPTSTPRPTFTEAPTLTPLLTLSLPTLAARSSTIARTPTLTAVPTAGSGLSVSADDIGRHLDSLATIAKSNGGIRAAGTAGYSASADYVARRLGDLGFEVQRDEFNFTFFNESQPVRLSVGDKSWTGSEWLHAMLYSAPGDVSGVVQKVGIGKEFATGTAGCEASDWSAFVAGHIALVEAGPCGRRDQVMLAQNAGAAGLIALYPFWEANQTRRPTLLDPNGIRIPAIVAGQDPTLTLLAAAESGGSAAIHVAVDVHPATDDNIIAEWPGATDDVLMLGAHLDSVLDGPGINDNGSGVATLLSLATSVSQQPQPQKTIRFAFWGAEEDGELGSASYVSRLGPDASRISAYFNLDMVASPAPVRYVYANATAPAGSSGLTQQLMDALAQMGKPAVAVDVGTTSDHYNFERAGIPSSGVFSGFAPPATEQEVQLFGGQLGVPSDPCYHLACDTRANVNLDSAVTLGTAVATVLQELAY